MIHFRARQTPLSNITFKHKNKVIEQIDRVRYFGMEMNKHVNLEIIANTLSHSATRVLGALTAICLWDIVASTNHILNAKIKCSHFETNLLTLMEADLLKKGIP